MLLILLFKKMAIRANQFNFECHYFII